jgi:hypothetical protein
MEIECGVTSCIPYILINASLVIVGTILLDIILYFLYGYLYVEKYYSYDLIQQRDKQLAKYDYYPPGSLGSNWSEMFPPVSQTLKSIANNDVWVWGTNTKNQAYVCKYPCEGEDPDSMWRSIPKLNLKKIVLTNKGVWAINQKDEIIESDKLDGRGKWKGRGKGFLDLSVSKNNRIWAINKAREPTYLDKKWVKKGGPKALQILAGQNRVYIVDVNGIIYTSDSNGSTRDRTWTWTKINAPVKVKTIRFQKEEKDLYIISDDYRLYSCTNNCTNWSLIKDAPRLTDLNVSQSLMGISTNGKLWRTTS